MPLIALPALPRAIAAATGSPAPSYRAFYAAALDGRIPAIAAAFGLSLLPANKGKAAMQTGALAKSARAKKVA